MEIVSDPLGMLAFHFLMINCSCINTESTRTALSSDYGYVIGIFSVCVNIVDNS